MSVLCFSQGEFRLCNETINNIEPHVAEIFRLSHRPVHVMKRSSPPADDRDLCCDFTRYPRYGRRHRCGRLRGLVCPEPSGMAACHPGSSEGTVKERCVGDLGMRGLGTR